ncbi:MAG TPA: hypothetical protein VL091_09660, partial [Marinobacter sp.]|nr:hypothetical protein [Marinobacter sp.]
LPVFREDHKVLSSNNSGIRRDGTSGERQIVQVPDALPTPHNVVVRQFENTSPQVFLFPKKENCTRKETN